MLRTGIIGMGKMGRAHAGWILNNDQLELTAICEKNASRVAELKQAYNTEVYSDVDEFLKAGLDVVVIVTTNESHEPLAVKALEAKAHVVVEKPMSMTYQSTQRMIKAANAHKRKIMVHQSSRWDRDYLLVKDTIASGKIGDILCIQSKAMFCDEGWPSWGIDGMTNPWRIKAQYGGGMLLDWGPHLVDQMIQMMGQTPKQIYGVVQAGVWSKEVDDYFFASLKFDSDTVCQIECSNNAKLDLPRWYAVGTKGTILVKGKREPFWDQCEITYINAYGKQETSSIHLHDVKESGLEGGFYENIVPYLSGEPIPFVEMQQASDVIRTLELIKKSSDESRVVEWKEI